ncbi:MAG: Crp/Fnr family transcriptional regulator [Bacilli bacterium]|nr:Crp/Fnr family transcriptional regulator [Bacilli bacterium]
MPSPFEDISKKNQKKLLWLLESKEEDFTKGTSINSYYKNTNIVGIIISGAVQIVRANSSGVHNIIEELREDEVFTTGMNIYSNEIEIIAIEDTKVIIIDYDYIISNINNEKQYFNKFIKNMFQIYNEKLKEKNERLEILSKKSIRNKLLTYFEIQYNKRGSKYIYLPFNFKDLAEYLSIDRAAMSRELKSLKDEGFIETKSKRITLLYKKKTININNQII